MNKSNQKLRGSSDCSFCADVLESDVQRKPGTISFLNILLSRYINGIQNHNIISPNTFFNYKGKNIMNKSTMSRSGLGPNF